MQLRELFRPAANLTPDQARAFMAEHAEGTYTLLDVRQPKEYEKERIPGSLLIPLPQLPGRLAELDRDQPYIVY